jgi:hypothetical protein
MTEKLEYPLKGSCNCGYIEYEVLEPFSVQVACHCTQCQKHTQSAFSLNGGLGPGGFRLVKGRLKKWTKTADSGNLRDCYFCPECGNRIYHDDLANPEPVALKLGTLDNTDVIDPRIHIWTSMKQTWYQIPEGVQVFKVQPDPKAIRKE